MRLQLSKVIALHPPPFQEPSWFALDLDMAVGIEKYGLKIADTKQNIQRFGNQLDRLMGHKGIKLGLLHLLLPLYDMLELALDMYHPFQMSLKHSGA